MKIGWAVLIGMLLIVLFPRARQMMANSPKGSADDWRGVILPLALVIGFVLLLISLVR